MINLRENLLELFFPSHCVICNEIGTFLCAGCQSQISYIEVQTCPKCNKISQNGNYCTRCKPKTVLKRVISAGYFKDPALKEIIHSYKYEGVSALSGTLSCMLIDTLEREKIIFDEVCFVPLSRQRENFRGYNQSGLIAKSIADHYKKPLNTGLKKVKHTRTQVGLAMKERRVNLNEAFKYTGGDIKDKKILLIDDVKTTGTTLDFCACVLRESGAKSVSAAVLAKE